jgi:hypothetical protein
MVLDVASPACAVMPPLERATDDVLALRVQATLASDPILKPLQLNLLVNVVDGQAVIGGELPDLKLAQRIDTTVSKVPGIRSVRVSCWESSRPGGGDPFARRIQDQMAPLPAPKPLPITPVTPPLTILSQPPDERDRIKPIERPSPANVMMEPVVASIASRPRPLAPGAAPLPYDTIPSPNVPTKPVIVDNSDWKPVAGPVDWQIVRDRDSRFAHLRVSKYGSQYTVLGNAAKLTDAWDFAEALQKLPGIDVVIVGRVEMK